MRDSFRRRHNRVIGLLAALSLGFGGAQDAAEPLPAALRISHLVDGPELDVVVDGRLVFTGLRGRRITGYALLPAGRHRLELVPTDEQDGQEQPPPVLTADLELEAGSYRTLAILGDDDPEDQAGLELLEIPDDYSQLPPPGHALLRLVHAARRGPALSVVLAALAPGAAGQPDPVTELDPSGMSDYLPFQAGLYRFGLVAAGEEEPLEEVSDLALEPGAVYTLFISSGGGEGRLRTTLTVDALLDAGNLRE